MSLGVLNNLTALYAENNLNNTNNSLNTVLQQLSSGSKINSGADDAAGLSLVDGLQANQVALTQSVTNATEGAGLLRVADGALSQVTSLLNRAVTLATEASNGTLNTSQDTAANQEYQSILSEITNIGSTTNYNGNAVFGSKTAIYTGDSTTSGSSINELNIRTLSSSNVGDSGGVMAYSNGQNNVFINLSSGTKNAQATDTLATGSTINVNYLVKGANGTETTATTSISVGGTSGYANTANGMIDAINQSGLGLTASFTTQSQAGVTGGGSQTGIQITGGLLSAGVDPNAASTSGVLNPAGITGQDLTLGQVVTVKVGGTTAAAITINSATNTLANLASAINTAAAGSVTANVITNGDGSQSLALADGAGGGALTVTSAPNPLGQSNLSLGTVATATVALSSGAQAPGTVGGDATATLGISGTNTSGMTMTGTVVLSNAGNTDTFIMGGSPGGGTIAGGTTMGSLASAIAGSNLGVTATVGTTGITITSATGEAGAITEGTNNLLATPAANTVTTVAGAPAMTGTAGTATIQLSGGTGNLVGTDALTGTFVLQNGNIGTPGTPLTIAMGTGPASYVTATNTITTAAQTVNSLVTAVGTTYAAQSGMTAAINGGDQLVLTSATNGTTISMVSAGTLTDNTQAVANGDHLHAAAVPSAQGGAATLLTGITTNAGDALSGSVVLSNNGLTHTFIMGGTSNGTTTIGVAAQTLTGLAAQITADTALGLTPTISTTTTGGISLATASTNYTTNAVVGTDTLAAAQTMAITSPAAGQGTEFSSATVAVGDGLPSAKAAEYTGGTLSGTIVINNNSAHDTFVMSGAAATAITNQADGTFNAGNTMASVIAEINAVSTDTVATLDISASEDNQTGGLFLQGMHNAATDGAMTVTQTSLTDSFNLTGTSGTGATPGSPQTNASIQLGNAGMNQASDTVNGSLTITLAGTAETFQMNSNATNGAHSFNIAGTTLGALETGIVNSGLGITGSVINMNGFAITAGAYGSTLVTTTDSLTDSYHTEEVANSGGVAPTGATNASATIGTTGTMSGTDTMAGSVVISNGNTSATFQMGTGAGQIGGTTLNALATAITDNNTLNIVASVANGALQLHSTTTDTTIAVGSGAGNTLTDTTGAAFVSGGVGTAAGPSKTTLTMGGTFDPGNLMAGSIVLTGNGNTDTFTMGATANGGTTLGSLESAIDGSNLNVSVSTSGGTMLLTSNVNNSTTIGITNSSLSNDFSNPASQASLGEFASANDTLAASTFSFKVGSGSVQTVNVTAGETVDALKTSINLGSYGVTAADAPVGANGFVSLTLTSNTYGVSGDINTNTGGVTDTTSTANLAYVGNSAYNLGLSNSTVYDASSGQSSPTDVSIVSNNGGSNGIATISYSDGAGASLSTTDLTNQTDAQSALTSLNGAITDVAAQDGYIGAQINTLNAVSQVLSTQQENVQAAQNAVQATDYASATSNMSKYEILSQTGIAALAQANSSMQEVTKLLQ